MAGVADADPQELESRKRIASLCLPSLVERTKSVFECYLADAPLRGSFPFPRFVLILTLLYFDGAKLIGRLFVLC
jgi:hypothetical protein